MTSPHRPIRPHSEQEQAAAARFVRDDGLLLYTPAEAARRLRVRESWLRKKAAARLVPSTHLGRHLRFSPADLAAIVAAGAQPAGHGGRCRRRPPAPRHKPGRLPGRDLPPRAEPSVHACRPDDHTSEGSTAWPG